MPLPRTLKRKVRWLSSEMTRKVERMSFPNINTTITLQNCVLQQEKLCLRIFHKIMLGLYKEDIIHR